MITERKGGHVLGTLTIITSRLLVNVVLFLLLVNFSQHSSLLVANAAPLQMPTNNHDKSYFEQQTLDEPIAVDQSSIITNTELNRRLQLIDAITQLILNSKLGQELASSIEEGSGEEEQQSDEGPNKNRFAKRSFEDIDKHLSEEDRKLIQEAISKNLINRLKNMYAVTTRSRYGKRSLSKRMLRQEPSALSGI